MDTEVSGVQKGTPTLNDVALRARVSPVSVSVAFNGSRSSAGVSESTRQRIFQAARELNYRPSRSARALQSGRSYNVAVLIGDLHISAMARQVVAIEKTLAANNYTLSVFSSQQDPQQEQRIAEHLMSLRPDGIIVVWQGASNQAECLRPLIERGVPIVTTERIGGIESTEVHFDRRKGMRQVTEHLFALGHRKLAMITTADPEPNDRLEGFLAAHASAGIAVDRSLVKVGPGDGANGYRMAHDLLGPDTKNRPTALVCNNDTIALAAMCAAAELGLGVPDRLSVTGFYDAQEAKYNPVPLTTIRYPAEEIGERAAAALMEKINAGPGAANSTVLIEPELIVRRSSAAPGR